jgi:hypothetical protein
MASLFDEDTPGWVRWALAGGAVVIVALIALVAFLVVGNNGDDNTSADPSQTSTSGAQSSSVCGLPDGDQSVPSTTPAATWELEGPLAMPSNSVYGPGLTERGEKTCYAHSPLGAVFFASNPPFKPEDQNPQGVEYAGFRVNDYSGDRATIELAARITLGQSAGSFFSMTAVVVWRDGDWGFIQPEDPFTTTTLSTLHGFVPFGPGRL